MVLWSLELWEGTGMKICREWKFLSVGLVDGVSW